MHILNDKLTPAELAAELGVTPRTVQRWNARRIGPPKIKIGKRVYYRREAVEAWMLAHEREQVRARGAA